MHTRTLMAVILALAALGPSCGRESRPAGTAEDGTAPAARAADTAKSEESPTVDEMPRLVHQERVFYPEAAKKAGQEGTVFVKAWVDPQGRVQKAEVTGERAGSEELERAALESVRQWTFEPAKVGGKAVTTWVVVPIRFKLDPEKSKGPAESQ